ncbi:MAG: glycosyltransferase, partial [candidate division Zixibacteria bacterium]|nr:glycosyltransferase [candidate division Zixibacteria bacterium]
ELAQKQVICRLHSYEAFAGFVAQIKWERIDDLIFVADHIKEQVLLQQPDLEQKVKRIHILPNGINLDRFAFTERTKGHNLAFVGDINYKKGPLLLFHAFAELVRRDPRYTLSVAGRFQDDRFALYFSQMTKEMGFEKNLRFDGWVDDISGWLDDKQYIVSSSLLEGHPVGLMEGMARGLKPVIHNFVGARGIYDDRFVWNTIDEFVAMVTSDDYDSAAYRAFVEDNFSLTRQLEQLKEIFGRIEKEINDR